MALLLFNLLPALPLDGGRVVKALLTPFLGLTRSTRLLSLLGMMMASALLALGLVSLFYGVLNVTLFFTGAYLFYAAAAAREGVVAQMVYRMSQRAQRLQRAGSLPVQWLAVSQELPISQLPSRLSSSHYHMLLVVGNCLEPEAILPESELIDALSDHRGQTIKEVVDEKAGENTKNKKMSFLF
jgi:stage IV sporulation protein FB